MSLLEASESMLSRATTERTVKATKAIEISLHRRSIKARAPVIRQPNGHFLPHLVRPNQPLTQWLQWLVSCAAVVGLLYLLSVERTGRFGEHFRVLATTALLLMVIVYHAMGVFRRYRNQWWGMARVAQAWAVTCGLLVLLGFFTKTSHDYSRQVVLTWFASALAAQCIIYQLFHKLCRVCSVGLNLNLNAIVIGSGSVADQLIRSINRNVFLADQVVGVVDDAAALEGWDHDLVPALGTLENLDHVLASNLIDRVYLALPITRAGEVARLHHGLQRRSLDVIWVPDIFALDLLNPSIREAAGIPLISLSESPMTTGGRAYLKSLIDATGACAALLALSPLMAVVAMTIKLTSPGPVIYRQTRTGWDGRPFEIWKFRTMYVHDEGPGVLTQARKDDDRITAVGRVLRRTSVDELPQLFNVLGGSMSLVGPRPHSIIHDNEYSQRIGAYLRRHRIKPGMTGWAQVHGLRGETTSVEQMRRRVEYDLDYINHWSLKLDLWILLRTPFALFSPRAY
jgi:Undecaprenyl-phosphate glucose phosphotransferase